MKNWKRHLALLAISLSVWAALRANDAFPFRIQYFTTEEGLPQNTVDCIFRDSRGYMWFATWNGLCRFDGYNYRVFKSDNAHKGGLPGNFVRSISEDRAGQLWIGTDQGLAVYNLHTEKFLPSSQLPKALQKVSINVIQSDPQGNIWIGCAQAGLFKISIGKKVKAQTAYPYHFFGLKGVDINALAFNEKNTTWIGTRRGLWTISRGQKKLQRASEFSSLTDVLALCNDGKGNFWVGTLWGLFRYNERSAQTLLYQHNPDLPNSLSHNTVTAICPDFQGNLLVGTLGGLNQYLPAQNAFQRLSGNGQNQTQLNNEFISALLCDHFGNVWIGTDKGGVNKYNLFQKKFSAFTHNGTPNTRLSHPTVNSILVEDAQLWIGTAGGGLNHWDAAIQRMTAFRHNPHQEKSLSGDFVSSLLRDRQGQVWVATWGQGLNRLDPNQPGAFQRFQTNPGQLGALSDNFISSLLEDPRGFLLIGTIGGMDLLDLKTRKAKKLDLTGSDGKPLAEVGCLLRDHAANYWVGTRNGLYRFAASDLDVTRAKVKASAVQTFPVNSSSGGIPGSYITSLREDSRGRIWIGTYGQGVAVGTHKGNRQFEFTHYNQDQGLCNNVIYCMEEDQQGRLWLSTDNGLARFDPDQEKFRNFYTFDGLLNNQFYWSASFKDANGRLYFGGINGLNHFDPDAIEDYPHTPRVSITDFKLFNTSVRAGEKRHARTVLQQDAQGIRAAELSYKDNVFSIEFACLDYTMPEAMQYAYKLEGVNQDWVVVPANRPFAQYNNLRGGTYLFKVKATNSDGNWSKVPTEFKLIIHPPFWDTLWFRIFGALLLIAFVVAYIHWRTNYLRSQKKKLEQQVYLRTQKIEGQKAELEYKNLEISAQRDQLFELHQKVEEASQSRLRFFTNISHEFRTPLTLIIDPIESLMEKYRQDVQSCHSLEVINRNAQRLLQLINQLMDFRRIESGKVHAKVCEGDLLQFVKGVYESFQDLAEHQRIQYQFLYNYPRGPVWYDAEKLENILYNLLSNAFKYTPEHGKIDLELYFEADGSSFSLWVRDTGTGIAADHLEHIFEHFYQVNSVQNSSIAGTGIGLALTRELVDVLNGKIKVESKIGKGTEFCVKIPAQANAFLEHELASTSTADQRRFNLNTQVDLFKAEITRLSAFQSEGTQSGGKDKPLLLVVEDNYDLRAFLCESLQDQYRILEASNGKEAYDMAKKYAPHLIISDIMMPVMDGLELCSRIKNNLHTCHIPVVLLTARSMVENCLEGLETGADDYIPKPFNLRILKAKIFNLIDSRRKLKLIFSREVNAETPPVTHNSLDEKFMERVYAVLETHYTEAEFSIEEFANAMHMSRSLLYKKLKALTDLSATDFITLYKLKKAIGLLESGMANISEIAFQVGFNDPKYFSRLFRRQFGMTPSEYQRSKVETRLRSVM